VKHLSRRSFLRAAALVGGGLAASRVRADTDIKTEPSKADLVRALTGVHNFMITPFHANYDLDARGLRLNVAHHARSSMKDMTIVVSGGLGELFTLSVEEHNSLVAAAVAGAQGAVPVVAGVGGGYRNALKMAQNAEAAGVDAILAFANPFACDEAAGAYGYLAAIARSVRIGVLAYPCGKSDFWPDVLKRLAELPNVIGFKDASGGVTVGQALGSLVGESFLWVAEGETHAMEALPAGARAYTSAVATFVPEACRQLWRHGVAGESARMKEVHDARIAPVVKLRGVKPGYGVSGIKVALEALGRAGGPVRPPGTQVAEEDRPAIAVIARERAERPWRRDA